MYSWLFIISVKCKTGDVELTNMQLKPEALNALKLPVRVKAGFLGSVKIKVSGLIRFKSFENINDPDLNY